MSTHNESEYMNTGLRGERLQRRTKDIPSPEGILVGQQGKPEGTKADKGTKGYREQTQDSNNSVAQYRYYLVEDYSSWFFPLK